MVALDIVAFPFVWNIGTSQYYTISRTAPTYLLSRRTCVFEEWGMLGAVREIV
jgi:hypothetical protein